MIGAALVALVIFAPVAGAFEPTSTVDRSGAKYSPQLVVDSTTDSAAPAAGSSQFLEPDASGASTAGSAAPAADPAPPSDGQSEAPPAAPVGPQLSINVDNGKTSTSVGDKLDYVITIQNLGTADVDGLLVNQSLPTGLEFGTADSGGSADATDVNWKLDLKATATATFHTSMTVAATPAELLRMATVACASTSVAGPPIVCASHSDQLPAGAAAQADQAAMDSAASNPVGQPRWYLPTAIGVVVLLGGITTLLLFLRRRRQGAADPE